MELNFNWIREGIASQEGNWGWPWEEWCQTAYVCFPVNTLRKLSVWLFYWQPKDLLLRWEALFGQSTRIYYFNHDMFPQYLLLSGLRHLDRAHHQWNGYTKSLANEHKSILASTKTLIYCRCAYQRRVAVFWHTIPRLYHKKTNWDYKYEISSWLGKNQSCKM